MTAPDEGDPRVNPHPQIHLTPSEFLAIRSTEYFAMGEWRDYALCVQLCKDDPTHYSVFDWFPKDRTHVPHHVREACNSCVVRLECLVYALDTRQEAGVWAGRSESQLTNIRKKLRRVLMEYGERLGGSG